MEKYFGNKSKEEQTKIEKERIENYKSRFIWWHDKQINLLTFSINLVFTISVALFGFIISNENGGFSDKFVSGCSLLTVSIRLLTSSIIFGSIALISRLNDFRLTKNKIKYRRRIFEIENEIKYLSCKKSKKDKISKKLKCSSWISKALGYTTWISFYIQFAILITLFIIISICI